MVSGNIPGDSRALEIQIPCIVFFVLTPLFVAIRFWSRLRARSGLGWDDWTLLTSFVFTLTVSALMMASCAYGFGQHIYNLSPENKKMTLKLFYVAQAFYKLTINLTKSSILLLYLRIFVQRYFRILCYVLLGLIVSYMVSTLASSIWQCSPIPRAWDKTLPGTCINITTNWYANAGFSIATDICILLLPMHPLYTSKLPRSQKVALMAVFTLGFFVTVTSILRMTTLDFSSTSPDTTYDIASSTWTMIEENVAVICACLPMCRTPLALLFPSIFASGTGSPSSSRPKTSYAPGSGSRHPLSHVDSHSDEATDIDPSRRRAWSELQSFPPEKSGIRLTTISTGRAGALSPVAGTGVGLGGDSGSQEYILATSPGREGSTSSQAEAGSIGLGAEGDEEEGGVKAIRKITRVEVSYGDRPGSAY